MLLVSLVFFSWMIVGTVAQVAGARHADRWARYALALSRVGGGA